MKGFSNFGGLAACHSGGLWIDFDHWGSPMRKMVSDSNNLATAPLQKNLANVQ